METADWELSSPSSVPTSDHGANSDDHLSFPSSTRTSTPTTNKSTTKAVPQRQKRRQINTAQDVLEKVSKQLDEKPDKFCTIGINIANKLRELPKETSMIAEKMINDILFEALMGNISRHTKFVLQDAWQAGPQLPIETIQSSGAQMSHIPREVVLQGSYEVEPQFQVQTTQTKDTQMGDLRQNSLVDCYSNFCSSLTDL